MVCFNFNEIKTKKTLIGLGLGQIISLLSTLVSFTASEIARKGISAPTSQSFLGYVSLAIVYGGIMLYRRSTIKVKWYNYFLLAFVDVEANFLVVKAYQNTSMTSVMLLDCWAIPCVLVLTWVFLNTRYRLMKISGVVICIVGVVMVVFSDVHAGDRAGGSNPVKGDFLVIAGASLYAVSNVTEEFLVKNADMIELMSFLGLFGTIIAAIQISIFERGALRDIHWTTEAILLYIGVALALFMFYSLITVLIMINGATMFNLSLLTSDMWAVLIRTFGYHEKVDWLYFLAFATTSTGLIIYSMKEKDQEEHRTAEVVDEEAVQRKLLDEDDEPGT
ncbi:Solute carrier family 35 member SLC35F1/F2/F6 [Arabidopsis thaliana x Arabidopsis arenosa]|uniref:Solute carrier family 35 member SLC35F1/F2/F6 n=1 Tax=Arabidopsis thaliana x Arabidopsis arenosa TaxID=1240361 RepID=A0A8T1ZSE3_9BRAS|nr:Solute carrier family 35 member SLC35F1/F2/F6 [Arabidopsis thaliana x Arabidopsis arenosa]